MTNARAQALARLRGSSANRAGCGTLPGRGVRRRTLIQSLAAAGACAALPRARAAAETLRIGVLLPRSGYLRGAGDACFEGAELARQLLPQLGYPRFELVAADSGEDPGSAARAAQELMRERIQLLVGCFDSSQTVEVAKIAEAQPLPLVINIAAAPSITQQGYRFVFRNFPDAQRIVTDSYRLQKELFRITGFTPHAVAVLYIENGRGIELIRDLFPQMGMPYELAGSIAYDPRAEDLSRPVAEAAAGGADALWLVSRMGDAIRITRELIRQDWNVRLLMSSNANFHDPVYREALGVNADYAVTFAPGYDPKLPLSRRVRELQAQRNPTHPLQTEQIYTFEAVRVAADAYRRARSSAPEALAAALRTTSLGESLTGAPLRFDAQGQNTGLGLDAIQNLHGVGQVVLPSKAAEARPVLPMPPWKARHPSAA